jgi:hypothetical protein
VAEHSGWSASGFEAMMLCPGKKVMEQDITPLHLSTPKMLLGGSVWKA